MEIIECKLCQQRWSESKREAVVECPQCHAVTGYRVVAEERIEQAKCTFDGARTIQEMLIKLRARADQLKELADDGWELREQVYGDYAYLERDLAEEEKERHVIEVVLPAGDDELHGRTEEAGTDVEDWF